MDSRIGLDYIVENADYTTKLGAGKTIFRHIEINLQIFWSVTYLILIRQMSTTNLEFRILDFSFTKISLLFTFLYGKYKQTNYFL